MGDFDALYATLDADPQRRGRQFEHLCKWFLENDPVYRHELRRVWLWSEWPGRWGGDAGIDLVVEDRNGMLWAIQAKAYDPKYRVTKRDVDRFLSESGRAVLGYRMLIATTDLIDRIGERTIQNQEKRVTFFRLNDLRTAAVDWPSSLALLRPPKRHKPAKPRKHQQQAVRAVVKGFEDADRGQLIMACGTGKTLTALFVTERLEATRTLVLLPSLSLLKQTLNVWRANFSEEFASLPVCSDETVSTAEDAALPYASDLGLPVTTDPEAIAAFLRQGSGPRVVFATYQSSPQIAKAFALRRVPRFDLVLADEAHRCAGPASSDFATVLDPAEIKSRRRLFITATPRYFTGRVLKAAQEADYEVASMDDESQFGPVFHRLTFGEAIERDLLTDYQVAVVGVDDDTYRKWAERGAFVTRDGTSVTDARTLAGQIGLAKAMNKYNLRRVISFHSKVSRARDFAAEMPEVIDWMPSRQRPSGTLWSRFASGEMPAGDRYMLLQHLGRLDDGDRGLLSNARCLAEGVDVPTLDGVAFIDPRRSEVDIVQAVGRAIRKSENKSVGTIVIPVFIDTDADAQAAMDDSAFKPVWDVIKALRAHDEQLGVELDELRRALGRRGGGVRLPGKIHFDIPVRVGADFANAFRVQLVAQTTRSWEFWFGLLERYVAENGTAQVYKEHEVGGYRLGGWCAGQRVRGRQGALTSEQRERLESLPGWVWERHDSRWEEGLRFMAEYAAEHGHALIPSGPNYKGYPLGTWAAIQRRDARSGKLSVDRRKRLDRIPGWVWSLEEERWERGFQHLHQYVAERGNSRVVQTYETSDGFRLGAWVAFQRARYAQGKLERDRAERLGQLPGWVWKASEAKWEEGFERLKEFADKHGHVRVPIGYTVGGFKLRTWYANQRPKFHRMSHDRQRRLMSLPGWDEGTKDAKWEIGYRRLCDYVAEHGHARVERPYVADGYPLGSWAMTQRQEHKSGKLTEERIKRLEALPGWDWTRRVSRWEEGFSHLVDYLQRNRAFPPRDHVEDDGYRLGAWVGQQRQLSRSGRLSHDRWDKLDRLKSWEWTPRDEQWQNGFRRLTAYLKRNEYRIPYTKYVEPDGFRLGAWVAQQRQLSRSGKLSLDRWEKLDRLKGWEWSPGRGAAAREPI